MQVFYDYLGELNLLAVLVAALAAFATGAIWYSNALFGKQWQKEVGLSDKQIKSSNMTNIMAVSFLSTLVVATALGLLIKVLVLDEFYMGLLFGAMVAVGILGANKLIQVKFEKRSMRYWLISLGADVFALSVMGAILVVWQ